MPDLQGVDSLSLDWDLTDEERLIRDTVWEFVNDCAMPTIAVCHREGISPARVVKSTAELGFLACNIPDEAERLLVCARVRQLRAPDLRGEWRPRRVPSVPTPRQHRVGPHLRGEARHSLPDSEQVDHRYPGLLLSRRPG